MRLCYLLPWIHTAGQVLGQLRQPASFHAAPSARRCVQATTHVGVFILCVGEGRGGEGREAARLAKVRAEEVRRGGGEGGEDEGGEDEGGSAPPGRGR